MNTSQTSPGGMRNNPYIINLLAGPGAGKSTIRAEVFSLLKRQGHKVEEVTEFAKDLTWEGNQAALSDQLFVLGNQNRRLSRLKSQVDFIVSDSPILLGIHYVTPEYLPFTFERLIWELWDTYNNINFFIERNKPYSQVGRTQTKEEAEAIDKSIISLLENNDIPFITVRDSPEAAKEILVHLSEKGILNGKRD